mgnify:CR=1 FL=1
MLRDEQITDEEYKADLGSLTKRYASVGTEKPKTDWYSEMNEIVDLTLCVKGILEKGSMKAKRNILSKLGSNLVWNEEILNVYNKKSVNTLVQGIKSIKSNYPKFEPKNCQVPQGLNEKTSEFSPVFSSLLGR